MKIAALGDPRLLSNRELLDAVDTFVAKSNDAEADLLRLLAELDERKLYLERAQPSLFAFCMSELGFSESVTHNRIVVARASRQHPEILDHLRAGRIHLSGLRVLAPLLRTQHRDAVLAEAAGKSKRQIEEIVARHMPQPAVPDTIRRLPLRPVVPAALPAAPESPAPAEPTQPTFALQAPPPRPAVVAPLTAEEFRFQFSGSRALRDLVREAQDLLRHQIPDGNIATIMERALRLMVDEVKKQRFAVGRKPRRTTSPPGGPKSATRHVPADIARAVHERDGGQCAFVDDRGHRCPERGWLQIDHLDGFGRDPSHSADRMRLLCAAHNQHAAERMYGREFMARKRAEARQVGEGKGRGSGS